VVSEIEIEKAFNKGFSAIGDPWKTRILHYKARESILSCKFSSITRLEAYRLLWWLPDIISGKYNTELIYSDISPKLLSKCANNALNMIDNKIRPEVKNYIMKFTEIASHCDVKYSFTNNQITYNKSKVLALTIGIAGCGKTTYIRRNLPEYAYICMDRVRGQFSLNPVDPTQSSLAYRFCVAALQKTLSQNKSVIWDATSLTSQSRVAICEIGRKQNYRIKIIYFDIPLEVSLKQNIDRIRIVPEKVIKQQWMQLEPPHRWEADDIVIISADNASN